MSFWEENRLLNLKEKEEMLLRVLQLCGQEHTSLSVSDLEKNERAQNERQKVTGKLKEESLRRILALADQQRQAWEQGDLEKVERLQSERQKFIGKIKEADDLMDQQAVLALQRDTFRTLITEILERDKGLEKAIQSERDAVTHELSHLRQGKDALSAYYRSVKESSSINYDNTA